MFAITPAVICAVKLANSFTKHQHLFDITATPIDIDLKFCCTLLRCSCFNFAQNVSFSLFMVVIASREFYRKSIQYSCKAKEILTAQDRSLDGQKLGWKRQKMPLLQHRPWRHKNKGYLIGCSICIKYYQITTLRACHQPINTIKTVLTWVSTTKTNV